MESRALGRGLSALIPEKIDLPQEKRGEEVAFLKTSKIKNNAQQPRTHYDTLKLEELKSSIKDKLFLQPILVCVNGDEYEVIAGERRLRAARALGLEEVPAIIKNVSLQESFVLSLSSRIFNVKNSMPLKRPKLFCV